MMISIARENDLEDIAKIDRESNLTSWSNQQYRISMAQENEYIYLLSIDDRPCAFIVISWICQQMDILQLVTAKNMQRKGMAFKLLSYVIEMAKMRRLSTQVTLEVRIDNYAAIELYTKFGFNIVSHRKGYYLVDGARVDAFIMVLQL